MRLQFVPVLLFPVAAWGFQTSPSRIPCKRIAPAIAKPEPARFHVDDRRHNRLATPSAILMSDNQEYEDLIEGRRILTMVGYRIAGLVYLFLGMFIIGWQAIKGAVLLPQACYIASGPILAAGVSYVLEGAAVNDRLSSEAFKRLNLFLAQYGALWLLSAFLIRKTGSKVVCNPFILTASAITAFNSLKAWIFGVKGWEMNQNGNLVSDFKSSVAKYTQSVFSVKSFPGSLYLLGAIIFTGLKLSRVFNITQLVASGGAAATVLSKDLFRISLYSLLSSVLVSLKDGGDLDRLTGSSYVELNFILTLVLGTMAAYFYNLGVVALGAASAFLSFFSGTMAYLTFKEKRQALI